MKYPASGFVFRQKAGLALRCKNDEHLTFFVVMQECFESNYRDQIEIFLEILGGVNHFILFSTKKSKCYRTSSLTNVF